MKVTKKKCDGCEQQKPIWKNITDENGDRKRLCKGCYQSQKPKSEQKPHPKSDKKLEEDKIYYQLRKEFLTNNPICKMNIPGCTHGATDVHHKKGRGKYYLDVSTWLPGCRSCHCWISVNTREAIELGLSETRYESKVQDSSLSQTDREEIQF